ncbi:MAG: imidazole glycerol phosphate synthase subunit HisH [Litorimonas sp.]
MSLVIVDTGCANLASVQYAFERIGVDAHISETLEQIKTAERVILPGVGSAPYAMEKIREKGLTDTLQALTQPVLGICLGMQLIFDTLDEGTQESCKSGEANGLGLIPGRVSLLNTQGAPSPHMGWNTLNNLTEDPLLSGVNSGDYAYFVHSFAAPISDHTLASAQYGNEFSAIVRHRNIWGCQFHPERSSDVGAQILQNFSKVTL